MKVIHRLLVPFIRPDADGQVTPSSESATTRTVFTIFISIFSQESKNRLAVEVNRLGLRQKRVCSVVHTSRFMLTNSRWQGISGPIAAVLEARISADHHWLVDHECMTFAKIGAEAIDRDAAFGVVQR